MAQYSANFNQAKVLVLGDVMLDRYWFGATNRISPEAPVPVVRVQDNEERAGGAANVAMNIASLNVPVQILGLIGQDETGTALTNLLQHQKIDCNFVALNTTLYCFCNGCIGAFTESVSPFCCTSIKVS